MIRMTRFNGNCYIRFGIGSVPSGPFVLDCFKQACSGVMDPEGTYANIRTDGWMAGGRVLGKGKITGVGELLEVPVPIIQECSYLTRKTLTFSQARFCKMIPLSSRKHC